MKASSRDRQIITHLGRASAELDPKQAAHENRILACLRKRGTLRENEVKLYTASTHRVGRDVHNRAIQHLVEQGLIRKMTTTRANSFILELTGTRSEAKKTARSESLPDEELKNASTPERFAREM